MKRIAFIAFLFIITTLFLDQIYISAKESESPLTRNIKTYEVDVTGDGTKDKIVLKGTLFDEDSPYFRKIEAHITTSNKEEFTIQYGGGYDPTLQFIDLNHNNIADILFQSATGGSGGLYNYKLHTIQNNKLKEIPLPAQQYVEGSFQDNFQVALRISPVDKPIIIDVNDRKDEYIRLGIYNKEGKVLKKEIMIDPIAFYEPVQISKQYGLKSFQQISGAYHADQLGIIETVWYMENKKWIALQTKWVPSNANE